MNLSFRIINYSILRSSTFLPTVLIFLLVSQAPAQTWLSSAGTGDWNTGTNWDTGTIPSSNSATASFGTSGTTSLTLASGVSLSTLQFDSGASAYSINTNGQTLAFFGAGIVNASSSAQSLVNGNPGTIDFYNASSAGNMVFSNNGLISFNNASSAGSADITTGSGGSVLFQNGSTGGTAQFTLGGSGSLDISGATSPLTVGSVSGAGFVSLGGDDLADGSNNQSTTFFGILADGGAAGGTGGSLTKAGSGTLSLTGANTYTGGTTLAGGTLNLGNNNALGMGELFQETGTTLQAGAAGLAVTNNVTFNGADSYDVNGVPSTLSGVLGGTGSLSVTSTGGYGVLSLTGTNTYSGGTTVEGLGAVLNIQNAGNLGNNGLVLANGGALQAGGTGISISQNVTIASIGGVFDCNGLNSSLSGVISGPGGLAVTDAVGAGSVTLSGINTYSGGTAILAGRLVVATGGLLGTGPVSNLAATLDYAGNAIAGTALLFNQGVTTPSPLSSYVNFFDYASAGSATIYNLTNGYLNFYNNSTADHAWIDNIGGEGLLFHNNSDAGNAEITNTGSVYFGDNSTAGNAIVSTDSGGSALFYGAATGGTAQFTVNGTGVLDISNETSISVTVGSLAGSGFVRLGNKDLTEGSNNLDTAFSGVLADGGLGGGTGGGFTKFGTGSLTLSGNNTYSGGTAINGGTLVAASGNALGTGNVVVNSGALVLAGPLTLNIGGGYNQGASGELQMGLGPSHTQLDALDVTGAVTLGGTLQLVPYGSFHIHDSEFFTLLTGSGVSGTFNTVDDGLAQTSASLMYNPTDVVLDLTGISFAALGNTRNQKDVGAVLDKLVASSPGSTLITYLDSLSNSALPGVYDQLSPANLASLYQMGFATAQVESGLVGSHISELFGDSSWASSDVSWNGQGPMFAGDLPVGEEAAMAKDLQTQRWSVFVNALGNFGTVTGDSNGPGYQYSTGGTAAGLDYRFGKDFVGGLLLGYSSSGTSQSTGTVNSTGGQAGFYAGWKQGSLHIAALAAGGINNYATQRQALGGTASGSTQGTQYSGELNVGYDLKIDSYKVTPFVTGQYTNVSFNAFTETGSLAPLSYEAQNEGYLTSDLGAGASRKWDLGGNFVLSPRVSVAWEHVYQGNLDSLSANFGSGANFTVNGSSTGTDAAVLGAGVNASFAKGLGVYVNYQGKVGLADYTEQNISGGVGVGF